MSYSIQAIVDNGYCVGCGLCASVCGSEYEMAFKERGVYEPMNIEKMKTGIQTEAICPFSDDMKNEDEIGKDLFGSFECANHDQYLGYYLKNYAGYIKKGDDRNRGSSGGFGTWLLKAMMETSMVSHVIHVKRSPGKQSKILFKYAVSDSVDSLREGAKSKYYPVEISEVIDYVRIMPGRYAFVGVPCFIKAVRLLSIHDPVIAERIKYTVGLVCGHLKSDRFAKFMGWQMGIAPDNLTGFDFRIKLEGRSSSNYGVEATGIVNGKEAIRKSPVGDLFGTSWGYSFFKLNACDYCDDVLAETADISIGDAWLPEYVKNTEGTNIITIRNPEILNLIRQKFDELQLDELSAEKIFTSQAGGFRQRRDGLSYRLYLKEQQSEWYPKKRVQASNEFSENRKKIYKSRVLMTQQSDIAYDSAYQNGNIELLKQNMKPILSEYDKLFIKSFRTRMLSKSKRMIMNLLKRFK